MLKIKNKVFKNPSTTDLSKINDAIKTLPQPTQASNNITWFDSAECVLCLQRESAYVDLLNPINENIYYLGTKSLYNCIFVYIYSDTDHFAAHVDIVGCNFDLIPVLSKFNYKDKINVSIVGGDPAYPENSYILLNKILIAEVSDLKHGSEAIESRARIELGMIKKGEQFYQIVSSDQKPGNK